MQSTVQDVCCEDAAQFGKRILDLVSTAMEFIGPQLKCGTSVIACGWLTPSKPLGESPPLVMKSVYHYRLDTYHCTDLNLQWHKPKEFNTILLIAGQPPGCF
jgi:hypothetical protein